MQGLSQCKHESLHNQYLPRLNTHCLSSCCCTSLNITSGCHSLSTECKKKKSQLSATAECVQRRRRAVGLLHKSPAFIQPSPTHPLLPASSFAQLQLSFMEVTNPLVVTHLGRDPPPLQLEKHHRHVHRQQKCTLVSHELIRGCTRAHRPHIYADCT